METLWKSKVCVFDSVGLNNVSHISYVSHLSFRAKFAMIVGEKFYLYRFLEYKLLELEPELDFIRLTLTDFHKHGQLDTHNRLLL